MISKKHFVNVMNQLEELRIKQDILDIALHDLCDSGFGAFYITDYQDIIIALLEIMAKERHIEKFKIYTLEEFLNLIKDNEKESNFHSKIKLSLNGLKRIAIENITQVNVDLLNKKLISLLSEEEQENR